MFIKYAKPYKCNQNILLPNFYNFFNKVHRYFHRSPTPKTSHLTSSTTRFCFHCITEIFSIKSNCSTTFYCFVCLLSRSKHKKNYNQIYGTRLRPERITESSFEFIHGVLQLWKPEKCIQNIFRFV